MLFLTVKKLIGTTEHVKLLTRCRVNRCRFKRDWLYLYHKPPLNKTLIFKAIFTRCALDSNIKSRTGFLVT